MNIKIGQHLIIGLLLAAMPLIVSAEEGEAAHQIGIAAYASGVDYENQFAADDAFSGAGFFYTGAVNNNVALRVGLFSGDYDGDESVFDGMEASGHDMSILLGGNLKQEGFKGYVGLGFFSEKWEKGSFSQTFSGTQIGLGIGYNIKSVAFDLWVNARDASDYEDYWGVSASAVSSGLMVSARF